MLIGCVQDSSPLVSFNHVIDPHFVIFSNSLYTTVRNPNPNPNRNPTVINDPQISHRHPRIVTVLIRVYDMSVHCIFNNYLSTLSVRHI